MGISSINLALGNSYGAYNQKLTQRTRARLEALGISYDANISENEAKRLIQAHEAQNQGAKDYEGLFQNGSGKDELFEKAKKLAQKLGIEVSEKANFEQLLQTIQTEIEQRLNVSKNDVEAIKKLRDLSQELAFIQAQSSGSSGYDNTNQALMQSLEMLSAYNKNFLNR